jgi:hypothetical protein
MQITDVRTTLLTGPSTNDPFLREARKLRSAAFVPPDRPGLGVVLTDEIRRRYPFNPVAVSSTACPERS